MTLPIKLLIKTFFKFRNILSSLIKIPSSLNLTDELRKRGGKAFGDYFVLANELNKGASWAESLLFHFACRGNVQLELIY